MPPCPCALAMARVPARRWTTRDDVYRRLEVARMAMDASEGRPSLAELAQSASLSPFHFHRLFREAFGQTPQEYIRTRKLERALVLLRQGRPANEACAEAGFMSVSSFSRAFRARFGHTPGATLVGIGAELSNPGQSEAVPSKAESTS